MTSLDSIALHRTLGALMAEVTRNPSVQAELARARREFFGVENPAHNPLRQLAAETRFAEWYLLERESELLGEVPVRQLVRSMAQPPSGHEALMESTVSVYRVESGDEIVVLRDLQDRSTLEMERPSMLELSPGDLLVGRLFASERGYVVPSAAVAVRPEADRLLTALESDLMSLDLERRLTQVELEHLLFRHWEAEAHDAEGSESVGDVERELQRLLAAHGVAEPSASQISAALREAEQPGAVMGPLLDQAAFDTDIDLEQLRLLLLRLWNAQSGAAGAAPPAPEAPPDTGRRTELHPDDDREEGLGERLARRIEAGRAQHEDMEKVFEDVADMLGEAIDDDLGAPDSADLSDGEAPAPLFGGGDLEPLIGEFLWEEDCSEGPEAEVLGALLRQQQEAPVPNLDLESLAAADLLRLLLRFYLESLPSERCERVQATFAVLERFCLWAQRTQEYALAAVVGECRAAFVDDLPRLHAASLGLGSATAPGDPAVGEPPVLWRVLAAEARQIELGPLDEDRPVAVVDAVPGVELRDGDLVLAALQRGANSKARVCGMAVVLPASAESLLG